MDLSDIVKLLVEVLSGQIGIVAQVIGVAATAMGAVRMIAKPLSELAHKAVELIPGTADDKLLADVEASQFMKIVAFLVDFILSIKIGPRAP